MSLAFAFSPLTWGHSKGGITFVVKGLAQRATGDDLEIAGLVAHHAKPRDSG